MEARIFLDTSVEFHAPTRRHIPQDRVCHGHLRENLKPYILRIYYFVVVYFSLVTSGVFVANMTMLSFHFSIYVSLTGNKWAG